MNAAPDPTNPVYQTAAKAILEAMRESCEIERERCGEIEETWPKEMRIHPASDNSVEGVLYIPKSADPVRVFQACSHDEEGEIQTHVTNFIPITEEILHLAMDYKRRAEHFVNVCICGHVIPKLIPPLAIQLQSMAEAFDRDLAEAEEFNPDFEESEDKEEAEEKLITSSEDVRISELNFKEEVDYVCPACGFKPNKRYD